MMQWTSVGSVDEYMHIAVKVWKRSGSATTTDGGSGCHLYRTTRTPIWSL